MADLFGDWVLGDEIQRVIDACETREDVIFQFLTKNPKRYEEFSFPENCWLGTTVESEEQTYRIDELNHAVNVQDNYIFVSFEPLLGPIKHSLHGLDWIIIGGMTGPGAKPYQVQWVNDLAGRAWVQASAVFIKDSIEEYQWQKVNEYPWRNLEVEV
jgi:protein gp37